MNRVLLTGGCVLALVTFAAWPEPAGAVQNKEQARFEGTWEGYVVMGRGEKPDDGPVKLRLVVKGDKMTATDLRANKSLGEGTFKIDPSKKIKEIDSSGTVMGAGKSRSYPGIYEIQGDTLKWCVDNQGKARPTDFVSAKAQYLLILKRQKS
jgi:uncharacterized protein (TIGR03067 family)